MNAIGGWRRHYGARAWWSAFVMHNEMRYLGGIVDDTYLPILRLVADDPASIEREWAEVKGHRKAIRALDSPHDRWKKTYGNFVRELDWAYRELHARLAEPDFEDLVVTTMGERLERWVGWTKRYLARAGARGTDSIAAGFHRMGKDPSNVHMMAIAAPIVGEVEIRGVEDGALVCYIPDCAMHKVVSDTEPQSFACLYGCKAACEAFLGPNDPISIHFEPNLPAFDCVMRVRAGGSVPAAGSARATSPGAA